MVAYPGSPAFAPASISAQVMFLMESQFGDPLAAEPW